MSNICSMTAFATQNNVHEQAALTCEIRSVNHRYLELSIYLPESLRPAEESLRELARRYLQRGKVECNLRLDFGAASLPALKLNSPLVQQIIQANKDLNALLQTQTSLKPIDLLRWPGVLNAPELDVKALEIQATTLFEETLKQLKLAREREGKALVQVLEQKLTAIDVQIALLQARLPTILAGQKQKLHTKINELGVEVDAIRLEQELAILTQKADVTEEMDRLKTHVLELRRLLSEGGAVGRRLDFLIQELNREANTLASKSNHLDSTQTAIELKVLIEQMREQVQNIE